MTEITEHHLAVQRTARYAAAGMPGAPSLWVVCHGYRQLARRFIRDFTHIAGPERRVVAPEGLSRFYLDEDGGPHGPDARVGATWMTREDRLAEIADYVGYLDALVEREAGAADAGESRYAGERVAEHADSNITALGFSQGSATAARWAVLGRTRIGRLILWGGGLPHDLDAEAARERLRGLRVTIAYGEQDPHVRAGAVADQVAKLRGLGANADARPFAGGHVMQRELLADLALLD